MQRKADLKIWFFNVSILTFHDGCSVRLVMGYGSGEAVSVISMAIKGRVLCSVEHWKYVLKNVGKATRNYFTSILQNFLCLRTTLGWVNSDDNWRFCVNCPFKQAKNVYFLKKQKLYQEFSSDCQPERSLPFQWKTKLWHFD